MRIEFYLDISLKLTGKKEKRLLTRQSWRRRAEKIRLRDSAICQYCGKESANGHVDHIIPLSRGGTDDLSNLAWSCPSCNLSKGDSTPEEWRSRQDNIENPRSPKRAQGEKTLKMAKEMLDEDPYINGAELGRRLNLSERHGLRLRKEILSKANGHSPAP